MKCLVVVLFTCASLTCVDSATIDKNKGQNNDVQIKEERKEDKFPVQRFADALNDEIPEDIILPDQVYNGPNVLLVFSTFLELCNTHLLVFKDNLEYEIGYENEIIPRFYTVSFDSRLVSDFLLRLGVRFLPFLHLNNQGSVTVDFINCTLSGQLEYQAIPPTLRLKTMEVHVQDVMVQVDKILNSEGLGAIFSHYLSSQATSHINESQEMISLKMKDAVNEALSKLFSNFSLFQNIDQDFGETASSFLSTLIEIGDAIEPFISGMP